MRTLSTHCNILLSECHVATDAMEISSITLLDFFKVHTQAYLPNPHTCQICIHIHTNLHHTWHLVCIRLLHTVILLKIAWRWCTITIVVSKGYWTWPHHMPPWPIFARVPDCRWCESYGNGLASADTIWRAVLRCSIPQYPNNP